MIGRKKWVQKLLNDQRDKLCNNFKVPNRTNQFQTQIVIERGNPLLEPIERENPLFELTQEPRKMKEKTSRSQEIETRSFHEEAVNQDRTGQPVVETGATLTRSSDDSKSFNVEDKVAHDRTGRPFVSCHTSNVPDGSQTRSSHESTSFNVGDETICDRTGQPVVNRDETGHEQTMLNEVIMDFRIPGLPHSVVKQAENSRVRQMVKKIQNHPDRQALQLDLQQNKANNPLSTTSKQMIKDLGNVGLSELVETEPKTQCKACLSYWSEGIVYRTCGHLLKETVVNRAFILCTLDLLSMPEHVIKKGRFHGHRYGETLQKKE